MSRASVESAPVAMGRTGVGTVRDLLAPTLRSSPWAQLAVAGGTATLLVLLTAGNADHTAGMLVDRLRLAVVLLAIGVAGALDDPTRPHLDAYPVRLALRQSLRIAAVLATTAVSWLLVVLIVGFHPGTWRSGGARAGELPVGAVTVVLVALTTTAVATAAVVTRRRGGRGVVHAAGAVVAMAGVFAAWPSLRVWMWPPYRGTAWSADDVLVDALWGAAHLRWGGLAVAATAVAAWALRDPWRPDRTARTRTATREGTRS